MVGNIPVTTTTKIFPKVLRYKWEAYCDTNGRHTAIQFFGRSTDRIPFPQSVGAPKALQFVIGGVLQYKLEVYCNTFLRSSGGWVSDILLTWGARFIHPQPDRSVLATLGGAWITFVIQKLVKV